MHSSSESLLDSQALLGKQIDGIWHTGVVIHYKSHPYPREWFYGGGIQVARAGGTMVRVLFRFFDCSKSQSETLQAGKPLQIIEMGKTSIPLEVFNDFLREISVRLVL